MTRKLKLMCKFSAPSDIFKLINIILKDECTYSQVILSAIGGDFSKKQTKKKHPASLKITAHWTPANHKSQQKVLCDFPSEARC